MPTAAGVSLCSCAVWLELCCRGLSTRAAVCQSLWCSADVTISLDPFTLSQAEKILHGGAFNGLTSLIRHHSRRVPFYALGVMSMLQLVSTVIIGPKAGYLPEAGKASDLPRTFCACAQGVPL